MGSQRQQRWCTVRESRRWLDFGLCRRRRIGQSKERAARIKRARVDCAASIEEARLDGWAHRFGQGDASWLSTGHGREEDHGVWVVGIDVALMMVSGAGVVIEDDGAAELGSPITTAGLKARRVVMGDD
ncbi:hypothetical protein M0R45_009043 [Rubus argutus]|uniref:Uncharacterized protein n=1 Tax=Rubus argutus TaxID=59490 RepID=A0AAW1Y4U7_RUBAR